MPYNWTSSAIYFDKNTTMTTAPIEIIIAFLRDEVGFTVLEEALPGDTFLPEVQIRGVAIVFDRRKLKHCGDLLHEAGHLILLSETVRLEHRANGLPIPAAMMDDVELGALA